MYNFIKILFVFLLALLFLTRCTTIRPPSLQLVKRTDTVLLKPVIINNETKTIAAETKEPIHDTIRIFKETILPGVAYMDTALLASYLENYHPYSIEYDEMKKAFLNLQLFLSKTKGSDSEKVQMKQLVDTTVKQNKILELQTAAANTAIFVIPLYIFLIVLSFIGICWLIYTYVLLKYGKKEDLKKSPNAEA